MFGHHSEAYVFGHGVDKFPAWMKKNYPERWRGFKRLADKLDKQMLEYNLKQVDSQADLDDAAKAAVRIGWFEAPVCA